MSTFEKHIGVNPADVSSNLFDELLAGVSNDTVKLFIQKNGRGLMFTTAV